MDPLCFLDCARLMMRPAPWQVLPKVFSMAACVPTSKYEYRAMSPGISTGWPTCR
jgi:hypothetical protein